MVLIVGAGVSGLSVANFLTDDNYLVIDKDNQPGGYCKTVKQDGFVWDYSGHFFHFRDESIKDYLVSKMPHADIVEVTKNSQIYFQGHYIDFPFQKNIHQLPREDFIDCLSDLFFREREQPSNFRASLVSRYGRAICEKFLFPYNEKLYACDLTNLDVDTVGRFFPEANLEDIIRNFKKPHNNSYNSTFTYPRGGAIEYINALMKGVDRSKLSLNEPLVALDIKRKIATTTKREIQYDKLVTSIPFHHLLCVAKVDHDPSIYSYSKVLVCNLGFDRKGDMRNHWVYFPDKKFVFYRVGYYDNIFGEDRMSLYVEVGLGAHESVKPEDKLQQVLSDLRQAGVVAGQSLVSFHSVMLDPAYVHITPGSEKDVKVKSALLNSHGIFSIGRYGGWKYCSIEDNIIEAKQLCSHLNS